MEKLLMESHIDTQSHSRRCCIGEKTLQMCTLRTGRDPQLAVSLMLFVNR